MIVTLRRKFIIINMILVFIVLGIVFGVICVSNYKSLENQSRDAMRRALSRNADMPPPKFQIGDIKDDRLPMMPIFSVTLDEEGNIINTAQENATVSDEIKSQAVAEVLEGGRFEGILPSLNLRYLKQETPDGTKIAFADMTNDIETMKRLVISLLLVGAGGLAAFFLISLFLSSWALRPVKKAWEQQRQFVADASHELKTPLTVILANTDILLSHRADTVGGQAKWVENTKTEATRMKKLVDDLLFLAKSDDTRVPMVFSGMDFGNTLLSCLLPFESVAYEQGVTIKSDIEPDIPISGDEGQIRQLISILLDNACKYAGEKGIITVVLSREQDKACLTVSNTGIGISPEDLEHIFERFYRADKSRFRTQGGYGLGLSIAKSIAENHRGRITASSSEGKTVFSVWLPVCK